MPKVAVRTHAGEEYVWYSCPGCKHLHGVPSKRWNWNGDVEAPTLQPSVRHFIPASEGKPEQTVCHYFIENGKIRFCEDNPHAFNGMIVDLVPPENVPENNA